MTTIAKCSKKAWCTGMQNILENTLANQYKKGVCVVNLYNMNNHRMWTIGIVYKKTSHDNGVILNVCPFCGENINYSMEPEDQHEYFD
jgi:hypothetical protein